MMFKFNPFDEFRDPYYSLTGRRRNPSHYLARDIQPAQRSVKRGHQRQKVRAWVFDKPKGTYPPVTDSRRRKLAKVQKAA